MRSYFLLHGDLVLPLLGTEEYRPFILTLGTRNYVACFFAYARVQTRITCNVITIAT